MVPVDRSIVGRLIAIVSVAVLAADVAMSATQQAAGSAATTASSIEAQLAAGDRLLRDRRWVEAKAAFESGLAAATQAGDIRLQSRALAGLTDSLYNMASYESAREHGLRSLDLAERLGNAPGIGRANVALSVTALMMGDESEAKKRAERAVSAYETTDDHRGRARATLALVRTVKRDSPEFRSLIERAIAAAHAAADANIEAEAVHILGDELFTRGDYAPALAALERAASLYIETNNTDLLGSVYNSVGRVYRAHGQLQTALEYQLKALELHERGTDTFPRMQSLNAVAAVYGMLGEVDKARTYTERALKTAEQSGSPRIQDFLRANLAGTLVHQGEYAPAVGLLEGVIARGIDSYVSRRYQDLSYALRKLGRTDESLRAAETAVERCTAAGGETDCPIALWRRAEAHLALGKSEAAISDLTTALDRIEGARTKLLPSDFFKQEFVHHREWIYSLAVALQFRQGRAQDALETAELARSRAFIDLLASRDVTPKHADQSQTLTPSESSEPPPQTNSPADPLSRLALTLRGPSSKTAGAVLPSAARHLGSLETAAPARVSDLTAIAGRLKSTLLVYWVAQDELFIWVVAPNGDIRTARVDVLASKLRTLVRATYPFGEATRSGTTVPVITTRGGQEFSVVRPPNAWRELYDLLIRPVRGYLPGAAGTLLTIVPHGPLAGLSFAALQNERGRYLLEEHELHYAPAGAVLQFTSASRRRDARSGQVLVVADPVLPPAPRPQPTLPALAGARNEARAIARQLPPARVTVLSGSAATESRVTAGAAHKSAVHFATHAIVRDDAPFDSYLALAADTASADGRLTAQEIYQLELNADLVILSACRSGGGRVGGDGIASFARAFIYAGTPSVIASVWDVADEATGTLIASFYRSWLAGAPKSRALRSAQLALMQDLRAGRLTVRTAAGPIVLPEHPIFWAGFALIGEPQ